MIVTDEMKDTPAPSTHVEVRDFVEAAYDLSTWAACISWNGGTNQEEWLVELREKIELVQAMRKDILSSCTSAPSQHVDGYAAAFYDLAQLLDIPARSRSPKEVWETDMLPRLRELVTTAPQKHVEGRLADLNLKVGDVVERLSGHDRYSVSDIGSLYDVQQVSGYFSSGLHLVRRGSGWTTMRDNGRFRVVSRSDVSPAPSTHSVWDETAPTREYVDTLKQEIERLRAIALDMQAGYAEATERAEEAVKAANALQDEVDRLRAALATTEGSDNG